MRITARVDYAVRAALELAAAAPEALTVRPIATARNPGPLPAGDPPRPPGRPAGHSQRGREGGYRLALPADEISIARVMRVEQGFLADVHGERPEDLDYPGAAARSATVWVAARASYRRVLSRSRSPTWWPGSCRRTSRSWSASSAWSPSATIAPD